MGFLIKYGVVFLIKCGAGFLIRYGFALMGTNQKIPPPQNAGGLIDNQLLLNNLILCFHLKSGIFSDKTTNDFAQ